MKREADHGRAFGDLIPSASVAGNRVWEIESAAPSFPVLEGRDVRGTVGMKCSALRPSQPTNTIKYPIKMGERQW